MRSLIIAFSCLWLSNSCSSPAKPEMPSGVFVRTMESEFSVAKDTVVIRPDKEGWLQVNHTTHYQRKDTGVLGEMKSKESAFVTAYDPSERTCVHPKTGGRYSFPDGSKALVYNGVVYTAVRQ